VLFANPAAGALFAHPVSELVDRSLAGLVPALFQQHRQHLDVLLEQPSATPVSLDRIAGRRGDASTLHLNLSLSGLHHRGEPLLLISARLAASDAAAPRDAPRAGSRVRNELAPWDSEAMLRLIMNSVPALIAYIDTDCRYRFANATFEQWLHRPLEEIVGHTMTEIFGAGGFQAMRPYMERVLGGETTCFEIEREYAPGERRWIESLTVPHRNEQGRVVGAFGVAIDISHRKALERTLRENEERLRVLFHHASEPVVIVDPRLCRYLDCNRRAEAFFGYSREQLLTKQVGALSAARQPGGISAEARILQNRTQVLRDEPFSAEWLCQRADGSTVLTEIHVVAIPWGGHHAVRQSFIDISARKAVEQELREARAAAEEANQAKTLFLASMSHEIRTPLNAVIGMGRLLLDSELPEREREYTRILHTSGQQLLALINDVLDFSKIEAGRLELEWQCFDLRTCLESALDLVSHAANDKGLELNYLVDGDLPGAPPSTTPGAERRRRPRLLPPAALMGDETRVRQILVNLLGNAIKFTDTGEVLLTATRHPLEDGADADTVELHFAVQDTGIGIPLERQDRLFRPFSQVHDSDAHAHGGTGLGLAISERLARAMGGRIWVESEPGQGSIFHVTLRLGAGPGTTLPAPPPVLRNKRLRVVGASPTQRRLLAMMAGHWGMNFDADETCAEAADVVVVGAPTVGEANRQARRLQQAPTGAMPLLVLLPPAGQWLTPWPPFAACLGKPLKPSQVQDTLRILLGDTPRQVTTPAPGLDRNFAIHLPLNILVVDDNYANLRLASLLLERLGYRADVVSSGREALAALRRQRYEVVLMDLVMPELDGLATTRLIHDEEFPHHPYIIAVTANVTPEDRRRCLAAGMDDFLGKPLQIEALMAALRRGGVTIPAAAPATGSGEIEPSPALPEALARLRETLDDDQAWRSFVQISLESLANQLALLHQGLEASDEAQVTRASHTLKSNAANVGEEALRRLCETLEALARQGDLAAVAERLRELQENVQRVRTGLVRLLREPR